MAGAGAGAGARARAGAGAGAGVGAGTGAKCGRCRTCSWLTCKTNNEAMNLDNSFRGLGGCADTPGG